MELELQVRRSQDLELIEIPPSCLHACHTFLLKPFCDQTPWQFPTFSVENKADVKFPFGIYRHLQNKCIVTNCGK